MSETPAALANRKVIETSNQLVYTALLLYRDKYDTWPPGCVRIARYCGKMYSRYLFGTVNYRFLGYFQMIFLLLNDKQYSHGVRGRWMALRA